MMRLLVGFLMGLGVSAWALEQPSMEALYRAALQDIATRDLRDVTQAQAIYLLQLRAQQALDAAAFQKEQAR